MNGAFLELGTGVLLVATCAYCFILSRKLQKLREGQAQMLEAIEKFDEASRRAERNLTAMQGAGASMNRELDVATQKANALADELSVMVHAGDKIAGRIEGAVDEVRALGGAKRRARPERLAS